MLKRMILLVGLLTPAADVLAEMQVYQADVEGMVCAFCAYSVSRDVVKLPGVEADSVDVDLENGMVTFSSAAPVAEDTLAAIFAGSGFTVSGLRKAGADVRMADHVDYKLVLDLTINDRQPAAVEAVLGSVGDLAAANLSSIVLTAPAAYETDVLKPILAGRKQVVKVRFVPVEEDSIHLQLFLAANAE